MFLLALLLVSALNGGAEETDNPCLKDADPSIYDISLNYSCPRCELYNPERSTSRIAGGTIADLEEYPFAVGLALKISTSYIPFCGGSIISPEYILTAGHCVHTYFVQQIDIAVLLGSSNRSRADGCGKIKTVKNSNIAVHPQYNEAKLSNDIAILKVTPILFGPSISPIGLPSESLVFDLKTVKIIGWGANKLNSPMSSVPRVIETNVVDSQSCYFCWCGYVTDSAKQLCTYSTDGTTCQGDSGGPVVWFRPLTQSYVLMGIVSFGSNCTDSLPAVHTNVTPYLSWIKTIAHL